MDPTDADIAADTMAAHKADVDRIAATVEDFYARKEPFRIYHGSTNSTRQYQYDPERIVDTSGLNRILGFDHPKKKIVRVEPNVPMDALVDFTLKHDCLPEVVPLFPGITAGGAFAGTAGESSSFKFGLFERTVMGIEMVLGNGEVVKASKGSNSDLFYEAASSFGTLGVTTLLEIRLISLNDSLSHAKLSHVNLEYYRVNDIGQAREVMETAMSNSTVDYLDGIMYAKNDGVVCVGRLTSPIAGDKIQTFTGRSDPWFYLHVEEMSRNREIVAVETIPIVDYLFRYDRGAFWVAKYAYKYFITPFNKTTRRILDYFMHTRVLYHALHQSGLSSQYILQDVAIPLEEAEKFMKYLDVEFNNYPIWICPLKQSGRYDASTHSLQVDKESRSRPVNMLNFGVWGPGPKRRDKFVQWNQNFESKVRHFRGQKCLFAHTYYPKKEFNEIYDQKDYRALREVRHATYLPNVYDKVKVDITKEENIVKKSWKAWLLILFWSIWPLAGLYGVYKVFRGGDYLLLKASKKTEKTTKTD